jgi:deoxyribonuclease-4
MNNKIGFHVSIAGGIHNAVDNAIKIGCNSFQIFTRNPRGWKEKILNGDDLDAFKSKIRKTGISMDNIAVHMPYLPNLSAPKSELYEKSICSLTNEIHRCSKLGIKLLVIHLGSHLGTGTDNGINQLLNSCNEATERFKSNQNNNPPVTILLENSAGQKNSIGSSIEELKIILDKLSSKNYGICIDTCHAFAAGYDLHNVKSCIEFLDEFFRIIGRGTLKLIHLNDSKGDLNSHLDRHEHIGLGKIGMQGISSVVNDERLKNIPMIMETPVDSVRNNLDNLKAIIKIIKK